MLTTLLGTRAATPGPTDDYWYAPIGAPTSTGIKVTAETASSLNAFMACVSVIAETLASLPLIIYRDLEDNGRDRAKDHPMYRTLKVQPNQWQTRFEFIEMMQTHILFCGNAFALIVPIGGGVAYLKPFNPYRMTVEELPNGRLRYVFQNEQGRDEFYSQDEVLHVRGPSFLGLAGINPVDTGAETIATVMAGERFAGSFFKNDATPSGALKHPGKLGPDAHKFLQASFARHTGAGAHKPRIFEEGMEWQQMGINAEEAQLIESRKFGVEEIARMMRVPLHLIQSLDRATFSNIEQQSLDFMTNTMQPWATRWELALQRDVIDDDEFYAEFLMDVQLRADILTRYQVYQIGIASKIINPNEVRLKENMNPYEGGDVYENPNTSSDSTDEDESEDEEAAPLKDDEQAAWFGIVLADAVDRITKAEIREIQRRIGHAEGDRAKFAEWVETFYDKHREFMHRTLSALEAALRSHGQTLHVDIAVEQYINFGKADLKTCTAATFEDWAAGRSELLSETIKGAIT